MEDRIAVARRRYNDTLQDYNSSIGLFPNNSFAPGAGFQHNEAYFQAPEPARQAPKVAFPWPEQ